MRRLMILLLWCFCTLPATTHAAPAGPDPAAGSDRAAIRGAERAAAPPRIGLVLSGGGARGAAHVGVLKVLEELRIPISVVVGTSMGALVGGTFASGMSPAEMERRLSTVDWDKLFVDDPPREDWPIRRKEQNMRPSFDFSVGVNAEKLKHAGSAEVAKKPMAFFSDLFQLPKGALAGQKVELFFSDLVKDADGVRRFDDLPIPFRAVATDLENGDLKVFDAGALPEVMRASMSVPGVFAPVQIDDHIYVDGGLVRNLPIDVARRMGVDLVIAVNLGSSYLPRAQLNSVIGVIGQMVAILTEQNVERSLKTLRPGKDILISPDLGDISSSDFDRAADAIRIGIAAGRAAAPRLQHLSLSPAAWAAWAASRPRLVPDTTPITQVQVTGLHWTNPALFKPLIAHQQGRPLDRRRLDADISAIYAGGDFENIDYDLDRRPVAPSTPLTPGPGPTPGPGATPALGTNGTNRLIVNAREKSWGPGYLTFGAGIMTDFEGDISVGLRGTYRRTWVNSLGAEWYTTAQIGTTLDLYSEFYQPFSVARTTFIVPSLSIDTTPLSVFRKDARIARYFMERNTLGLDLGATLFDQNGELRVGLALSEVEPHRDTGSPQLPESNKSETGLRARFVYDTLDSVYFPTQGRRLVFEALSPQPALGADEGFNRLSGRWTGAYQRGANAIVGRAMAGVALGSNMPYYDQFALGGLFQLSGYATDQFRGNRFAFGSLTYYRKIASLPPLLGRGIYLGGSLEVGQVEDTQVTLTQPGTQVTLTQPGTRFGSSLFLGADTWFGPSFLGFGLAGTGDSTIYIVIGRP